MIKNLAIRKYNAMHPLGSFRLTRRLVESHAERRISHAAFRHAATVRDGNQGSGGSGRSRHGDHLCVCVCVTWTPVGRLYEQSALAVNDVLDHGGRRAFRGSEGHGLVPRGAGVVCHAGVLDELVSHS